MVLKFEENSPILEKFVVVAIWIFSIIMMRIILGIVYEELIPDTLINSHYTISWKLAIGLTLWAITVYGVLNKSKFSRWIVLLFAYISLLIPSISLILSKVFTPKTEQIFFYISSVPSIIVIFLILYLFNNSITLRLYDIKRNYLVKEQVWLILIAVFIIVSYFSIRYLV